MGPTISISDLHGIAMSLSQKMVIIFNVLVYDVSNYVPQIHEPSEKDKALFVILYFLRLGPDNVQ